MARDAIAQVCIELGLSEEKCDRIRRAAEEACKIGGEKRRLSEYNIFMGKCVKEETGPITERFRQCALKWKSKKLKI